MAAASSAAFSELGDTQMEPQEAASPLQQQQNCPAAPAAAGGATPKKKRNQPGNPNPGAEVIALSPHTLTATNRFVCEVCNKGFQREQNLQLHRRGHNLPWKLKQKNPNKEVKRKVYVCPEPTCVHHDPARALGDLTGIKKHYCRKHGEKKWKCDKCNKRYAVRSDWKAHCKTCGTRDYRCECGTLFSRRDSFITHRAFCDALARENAQMPPLGAGPYVGTPHSMALSNQAQSSSAAGAAQFDHIIPPSSSSSMFRSQASGSSSSFFLGGSGGPSPTHQDFSEDGDLSQGSQSSHLLHGKTLPSFHSLMQLPEHNQQASNDANGNNLELFSNNSGGKAGGGLLIQDEFNGGGAGNSNAEQPSMTAPIGNHLSGNFSSSLYNSSGSASAGGLPQNSATALLLKAAQMGSTSSNHNSTSALLRAAGIGANVQLGNRAASGEGSGAHGSHFHDLIMNSLAGGSGGFSGGTAGLDDDKQSTRDFLGVGRGSMAPLGLRIGALDPEQMK